MSLKKIVLVLATLGVAVFLLKIGSVPQKEASQKLRSTSSPHASKEAKKARAEYWHRMLMDPATGQVPKNVRALELAHKQQLEAALPPMKRAAHDFEFTEHGPNNVGGRTRALALDVTNTNVLLAGGVSGGIWKSTDRGQSWSLKSLTSEPLTCSAIAQDTRPGQTHIWYYGTGEGEGTARYSSGNGIYKSTDSGETWNQLEATTDDDPTVLTHDFDVIWNMEINPHTGSLMVASGAIMRSTDGGASFEKVLGSNHAYTHLDIATDGTMIAAISPWGAATGELRGIFASSDDGQTWTEITPAGIQNHHERAVLAFAPSNSNLAYGMIRAGINDNDNEDIRFYAFTRSGSSWSSEDRSASLAPVTGGYTTAMNTQGNYNMALAVKPDDPEFIVYGTTNLFKNEKGMKSISTLPDAGHVGGYSTQGHHPDQHALVFDPGDPSILWSGSDGGVAVTETITRGSLVAWTAKNGGYNITQFYQIAVHKDGNDPRIVAGAQDNGTQYWETTDGNMQARMVSGGDGAWSAFTTNFRYQSSQYGSVTRYSYETGRSIGVSPNSANPLFIVPFEFDPNQDNVCYFLDGNRILRNTVMESDSPSTSWEAPAFLTFEEAGYISTIVVANEPADRIIFATYTDSQTPARIYMLDGASTATDDAQLVEITPAEMPNGVWIRDIAVNPYDGSELLAVASNYRVAATFHSRDAGATWSLVEGNLIGGDSQLGPSIRTAAIQEIDGSTYYWLGTTTGLYLASNLNGAQTNWSPIARELVGNVHVQHITVRPSDQQVFFATYGRGAFSAKPIAGVPDRVNVPDVRRDDNRVINRRRGQ